ncbi:PAS domain S-box protein [Flammeovirgaceae bacterium SG7u.111]|nr:PAS domain S-box protein [Flammeovirgaceae bacterium SG7u.132]WPO34548.1 PAS domain S-box protein [Flammeovirgaceae bacterium SG7u.111]
MQDTRTEIIQDISTLYELSLSVGKSLKLKENCDFFLKALLARKNFTYATVWLKESVIPASSPEHNDFVVIYSYPQKLFKASLVSIKSPFFENFGQNKFNSFTAQEHDNLFNDVDKLKDKKGVYVIYRLGELGFLKLYSSASEKTYSKLEMNKLYSVISKFSMSIQACLEHEKGLIEADQRIRAEKELLEKDKLYIDLLKNLQEGFVITDQEDKILFTNEQMSNLTGYSLDELIGQKAFQPFLPPSAWDSFEKKQTEESERFEIEQYCKDGSKIWIQVNAAPYKDAEGNIIGTFALVSDITQRKLAEKALKKSEEKLSLIIDTALDAVIMINSKSVITQWNKQAELIFGWKEKEAIGSYIHELIMPKQYVSAHSDGMNRYIKTGKAVVLNQRIEISAIRKNKEEFPIELAITPIPFEDELHFSAFVRDITDRKKAEKDLLEAKQVAEDSAKAKELFLAKMSHEIRTPMNAILGLSEIMLKTKLSETQNKYLDAVRFSAKNLLVIINDILDFSKIEADKLNLEEIPFSIEEVIENIYQLVQHKAEEKGIVFNIYFNQLIQEIVLGDPVRLNQTLLNMVNNAIKFTEVGSVKLSCNLQQETPTHQYLLFQVEDTGEGIPEEKLEYIFDSFEQADVSISRKYGGTGLGLTISKQLIELMGGEINVKTSLKKGTIFSFVIPFKKTSQDILEIKSDDEFKNRDYKGFQILLVEDNRINRFFASTILEQKSFKVETAENGKIGIEMLEKGDFDIVLMDIQMPIMNGIEATQIIRNKLKMEVPIIALTANAYQKDLENYKKVGMNDYVVKPFEEHTLLEKIDDYLPESPKSGIPIDDNLTSSSGQPMYDLSKLQSNVNQNTAFLNKMIQIFIDDTPEVLRSLEEALKENNLQKMSEIAHKLKSTIDLLKINLLKEPIRQIERYKENNLQREDLEEKVAYTKTICTNVIEELKLR